MEKKMDGINEKLSKIICLAYELSNNKSYDDTTSELPVAFISISGHVGEMDVRLHDKGWDYDSNPTHRYSIYFHDEYGPKYSPDRLDEIIAEMERLVEVRYKLENEVE